MYNFRSWELEFFILKELPKHKMEKIKKHISKSDDTQKLIKNILNNNQEFLSKHPFSEILLKHKNQKSGKQCFPLLNVNRRSRIRPWLQAVSFSLVFITLFFTFWVFRPVRQSSENYDRIVLKGNNLPLKIFKEYSSQRKYLSEGDFVSPNEKLFLETQFSIEYYAAIFSIDGRGYLTRHLPEDTFEDPVLLKGKQVLRNTFVLDDAPDYEKFFLIYSKKPFDIQYIEKIIRDSSGKKSGLEFSGKNIRLPDNLKQFSITLRKKTIGE